MSSSHSTNVPDRDDRIDVTLPLRPEFANTLRVVVSSIGADAGFSVDEIDDLRLAVSEVFNVLAESEVNQTARVTASLVTSGSAVEIELRCDELAGAIELDPLATTILSSVVDRHEVSDSAVVVVKTATESATRSV